MKRILLISLLSIACYSTILAQVGWVSSRFIGDTYTYTQKDAFSSFEVQYKGEVEVNDTDTDVISITPGGHLKIMQTNFGNTRSVVLESNVKGELSRIYFEGKTQKDFDPDGRKWLADVLLQVIRTTGVSAESRTKRIYKKGGTNAVLEEISEIESNSGKGIYFDVLLAQPGVTDLPQIAEKMGSLISSNSVMGSLFKKHAGKFLKDDASSRAFFRGVAYLSSNTETGSVLRHVLTNFSLTPASYEALLDVVAHMSSNTEMGAVLQEVNRKLPTNDEIVSAYAKVLRSMSSNTEKGSALRNLLSITDKEPWVKMALQAVGEHFSSNTEMGAVLRVASSKMAGTDALISAYINAVSHMSSNTEMGSTLVALLEKQKIQSASVKVEFYDCVDKMTSNTEMGNVLRHSVGLLDGSSNVNAAFFECVKHLSSNTEMGSVLTSVLTKSTPDKQVLSGVLDANLVMSSNSEIGHVLTEVAKVMPKGDKSLLDAYKKAAAHLSSDSEYRRVMESLE